MSEIENGICTKAFKATGRDMAKLRSDLTLNQKEFAKFLRVPVGTVATWENRKKRELPSAANVVYNLAETKTREVRMNFQRCLDDLKAFFGS